MMHDSQYLGIDSTLVSLPRSPVPSANITTLSIKVNIFAFAKIMSGTNCLGNSWKIWFDKVYDTKARAFQAAYSILPAASVIQNKGTLL